MVHRAEDGDSLWSDVRRAVVASRRAAGEEGEESVMKLDCAIETTDDTTSVYLASKAGQADLVARLLDANHDVNDARAGDNSSALAAAAGYRHPDVVDVLLRAGADINTTTTAGVTPLYVKQIISAGKMA